MINRPPVLATVVVLLALAPALVMVAFSFNADRFPSLPWRALSTRWYLELASDRDLADAVAMSLKTAVPVTIASLLVGTLGAWGTLALSPHRAMQLSVALSMVLLAPGVVMGLAAGLLGRIVGLPDLARVWIVHTALFSPVVLILVYTRLARTSAILERTGADLGASPLFVAVHLLARPSAPTIATSGAIVFALSWDEFALTWLLLDQRATLPVRIWGMLEASVSPKINALASIIFLLSTISVLAVWLLSCRGAPTEEP